MSDVINAHDLGIAGGYIIEAAMQQDIDQLKAENAKLREYARKLLTGYECGACGRVIDPFDAYCRHCGARLEDA